MDKRILLLTDFSENAFNAVRYALKLYSDRKCNLYFLHAYQLEGYSMHNPPYNPEAFLESHEIEKRKSEKEFEKLMKMIRLHPDNPKHTYNTIVTNDNLLKAVKDVIAQKDIDIIIMGNKGTTSSRTVVFGMKTINIMENILACPVLAIPEDVSYTTPKKIVFPTNYKISFKRRELKYLINIAQLHNSSIQILHIKESRKLNEAQQGNKAFLETLFKDVDHSFHEMEGMGVHTGINAFIDLRKCDMVAFVNPNHSFFRSMFSTLLVEELGYHSKVPVLVLKHRN